MSELRGELEKNSPGERRARRSPSLLESKGPGGWAVVSQGGSPEGLCQGQSFRWSVSTESAGARKAVPAFKGRESYTSVTFK